MKMGWSEHIDEGRAAWPELHVSKRAFLAYVRKRIPLESEQAHWSDLYLACACARGDREAVALFERDYLSNLSRVLLHLRPTPEFVDDVRQQLMEHLFVPGSEVAGRISEYSGRGTLKSWVRVVAIGKALNMLRKERKEPTPVEDLLFRAAALTDDGELGILRSRYRGEFKQALTSALVGLSPRFRNVLRLHYLGGMTLSQVATVYRVNRSTVVRWLYASRQLLLTELHQRLAERLKVSRLELESLLRLVRSQLEVSFPRLLADNPEMENVEPIVGSTT